MFTFSLYAQLQEALKDKKKIAAHKRRGRRSWVGSGEQVVEPAGCEVGWAEPGTCLLPPVHLAAFWGLEGSSGTPISSSSLPVLGTEQPAQPGGSLAWGLGVTGIACWHFWQPFWSTGWWGRGTKVCRFLCSCASKESLSVKRGKRRLRAQLVTYGTRPLPWQLLSEL